MDLRLKQIGGKSMTTFRELKPGMHLFFLSNGRSGFEQLSHMKITKIEIAQNGLIIIKTMKDETEGRMDSVKAEDLDKTHVYVKDMLWYLISDVEVARKMFTKALEEKRNKLQLAVGMMEFNLHGFLDFIHENRGFDYDSFFSNLQTIERTKELYEAERKKVVEALTNKEDWREFLNNHLYTYIKQNKIKRNDKVIGVRFSLPDINRSLDRIDISVDFENREPIIATVSDYTLKNFIENGTF